VRGSKKLYDTLAIFENKDKKYHKNKGRMGEIFVQKKSKECKSRVVDKDTTEVGSHMIQLLNEGGRNEVEKGYSSLEKEVQF